jgi:hypothetical protein
VKSLGASLASNPFSNVGGAADQQNTFILAGEKEPDRRQIDQSYFVEIQFGGPGRSANLALQDFNVLNTDTANEAYEPDTSERFNLNFQHGYLWDSSLELASTFTPSVGNTCGPRCGKSDVIQPRSMPRLFIFDANV